MISQDIYINDNAASASFWFLVMTKAQVLLILIKAYFLNQRKHYRLKKEDMIYPLALWSLHIQVRSLGLERGRMAQRRRWKHFPTEDPWTLGWAGMFCAPNPGPEGPTLLSGDQQAEGGRVSNRSLGRCPRWASRTGGCLREPGMVHPADPAVFRVHLASSIPVYEKGLPGCRHSCEERPGGDHKTFQSVPIHHYS